MFGRSPETIRDGYEGETSAKVASSRRESPSASETRSFNRSARVTTTQVSTDYQSRQPLPVDLSNRPTTLVTVPPKPLGDLPNPPPPGSAWERIEDARRKLGWSARLLSRKAGLSSSHYSVMALRNTWNADLATIDKFIGALVAAGAPENDLRFGLPVSSRDRQASGRRAPPRRRRGAGFWEKRG